MGGEIRGKGNERGERDGGGGKRERWERGKRERWGERDGRVKGGGGYEIRGKANERGERWEAEGGGER